MEMTAPQAKSSQFARIAISNPSAANGAQGVDDIEGIAADIACRANNGVFQLRPSIMPVIRFVPGKDSPLMACGCAPGPSERAQAEEEQKWQVLFWLRAIPCLTNSVFLPNSVESVKVRTETCEHHGSNVAPFTLDLKIKRGSLPPGFPTVIKRTCVVPGCRGRASSYRNIEEASSGIGGEACEGAQPKSTKQAHCILRACSQRTLLLLLRVAFHATYATRGHFASAFSSGEGRQRTYRTIDLLIMGMLEILYATVRALVTC